MLGTHWLVEQAPGNSADSAVVFTVTVPPSVFSPPPHRHPRATDSYEVLEGSFSVQVDGEWQTLTRGDRAAVPPRHGSTRWPIAAALRPSFATRTHPPADLMSSSPRPTG